MRLPIFIVPSGLGYSGRIVINYITVCIFCFSKKSLNFLQGAYKERCLGKLIIRIALHCIELVTRNLRKKMGSTLKFWSCFFLICLCTPIRGPWKGDQKQSFHHNKQGMDRIKSLSAHQAEIVVRRMHKQAESGGEHGKGNVYGINHSPGGLGYLLY
ncbi:uncharacterized protein LOC144645624 [Oculina patagonica]